MYRQIIIKVLQKVTGEKDVNLEIPEREEFGDYSSNVAMITFSKSQITNHTTSLKLRATSKSPREEAEEIVKKLKADKKLMEVVDKIDIAGPGFINFWLKKDVLISNLIQIDSEKENYGKSDIGKSKTVIVEYSSPNIAKPFTVGHLRSTIIGDAIANIFEAVGYKVLRDNHLGDWGTQFGKQIYAIKTWGDEAKIEKSEYPVKELVDLYIKFHEEVERDSSLEDSGREWFKKLEEGDPEARRLWQKCVDWSWREFEKIYRKLNVYFNKEFENGRGLGESFFEDKMPSVIKEMEEKGLLKVGEEGAKLVFFEKDKYPPAMILKKDSTTLYHTRDLATDRYRKDKYNPDFIINEVGAEQTLYFQQLFEMERMLGWFEDGQRIHVAHGLIRFKDRKMSTRKGNVIWLEEVLDEAKKRAYRLAAKSEIARAEWGQPEELISRKTKIDTELASGKRDKDIESIGIGAIKYNDLKRDPKTEIIFDWDEILNMEGNSGPYLQYTYARTQSVLRKGTKVNFKGFSLQGEYSNFEFSFEEAKLLRSFVHFQEVVEVAAKNYSPNLLCNYLYDLAQKFNTFYNAHRILDGESKEPITNHQPASPKLQRGESLITRDFRVALTSATGQVLKNGLTLLGIGSPERM